MVHYVVIEDGEVRPFCGYWGGASSWTRLRCAVTCPRCRDLLERSARVEVVR